METVNKVLELLESIGTASGADLYMKAVLAVLILIGGIWYAIWKAKARKETAEKQTQRDRNKNVRDNITDEDQNSEDGQSIRDRLRR